MKRQIDRLQISFSFSFTQCSSDERSARPSQLSSFAAAQRLFTGSFLMILRRASTRQGHFFKYCLNGAPIMGRSFSFRFCALTPWSILGGDNLDCLWQRFLGMTLHLWISGDCLVPPADFWLVAKKISWKNITVTKNVCWKNITVARLSAHNHTLKEFGWVSMATRLWWWWWWWLWCCRKSESVRNENMLLCHLSQSHLFTVHGPS